jgi:4-alpha-glucanotransferase
VNGPGKALFDVIEKALGQLPIVAEDLGVITPDVVALRDGCGFPGMRILQFAFGDDATNSFLPHNFVVNSVVYTGTHDNDTTRGWWDSTDARQRTFAHSYTGAQAHDVHIQMIRAACNSVARMAMFPLQDVLGLDGHHRMNTPGLMGAMNWGWRFEWGMVGADAGRTLGQMTAASGRAPMALLKQ